METNEITFMDFPDEILLHIFSTLSDFALLRATRVCNRFKDLAKETIAKKYDGTSDSKFYNLDVSCENLMEERKQHHSLLCTFGNNISAIDVFFNGYDEQWAPNHWLIWTIESFCQSITKAKIVGHLTIDLTRIICVMPNLTYLLIEHLKLLNGEWSKFSFPKLIYFGARLVEDMDDNMVASFIDKNRQLEDLHLRYCGDIGIDALNDNLKHLKSLSIERGFDTNIDYTMVSKMDNLKCLKLSTIPFHALNFIRNSWKNIECLDIRCAGSPSHDDIRILCSFEGLKELKLENNSLTFELLKSLMLRLPFLKSLELSPADNMCKTHEDLLNVASVCLKLGKLSLDVQEHILILNYDFYTRFADILESNQSNLNLEIFCISGQIVLTREEARLVNDEYTSSYQEILYWKGYDVAYSKYKTNMLDLTEGILDNITSYLHGNDLHAFYRTCKQFQQIVQKYLSENIFYASAHPEKLIHENVFKDVGEHILRMLIDFVDIDEVDYSVDENAFHQERIKLINNVNKNCKNLVEMEIKNKFVSASTLSWPNLRKLKFSLYGINTRTLRNYNCPKLTDLEINRYKNHSADYFSNTFGCLTSLKFGIYNEHVQEFLCALIPTIRNKLKELSLMKSGKWFKNNTAHRWMKLNNIITTLEQLEGLHLYIEGIEDSNFKFLFENCPKLLELSVYRGNLYDSNFIEMFRCIKVNCKQLKCIQLVGKSQVFQPSALKPIFSIFPRMKINLINIDLEEVNA